MGDFTSAVETFRKASDMRSTLLGDHQDTTQSYHFLGLAQCEMGDLKGALESLQKALQLGMNLSIGDQPGIANITTVEAFQTASDMRSTLLGDHQDTADSFHSLGLSQFRVRNLNKALISFKKALQLRKKLSIGDHGKIADNINNMGTVYGKTGDYKSAREQFQNTVDLHRKLVDKHRSTATSYDNLAMTHHAMGSYPEAHECCMQASIMRLEVLDQHVRTANSLHKLGEVHQKLGDSISAVKAFKTASYMRLTIFGNHQDTAEGYYGLGLAQCEMGDLKGALESLQRALQMLKKLSIGDQPRIADITSNIGEVYHKMGDYHSAREQFLDAVNLYKKLVDKHESTATSYHNLAITNLAMERYPEALECFKQASTMRLEVLGQHIHTANSFYMLGVVHHNMGDIASAVEAFKTATDMRSAVLGDQQDTAESNNMLGQAHFDIGDLKEALEYLQRRLYLKMSGFKSAREQIQNAVDTCKNLLDKQESTATSYYNPAITYLATGGYPEALECFKQASTMRLEAWFIKRYSAFQSAIDIRSTLLGDHPDTAESYHWLGSAQSDMGDLKGALES
ncbi:tetratricopeptide repeat protein 28-like [Orbicella faveolata]|uniref:tetratricopeptide repeat protein 28-like n=1 Tax=Orbicella faveolata TaxID=48498 RepID=UPI0009E436C2|nr:tetratricopeptide repeat protein 28-like [Orbicella faveolata]